jgi:hypothetical protein
VLGELQRALEVIYGVSAPHRVTDYLMGKGDLVRLGVTVRAPEELLVLDRPEGLELGLYICPDVLSALPSLERDERGLMDGMLPAFSTAAEGVSHFIYLTLRAVTDRTVSLLELEVQAEVDKFATALLYLWKRGRRNDSVALRCKLFDRVGFRSDLSRDERDRYSIANRLARRYAAFLETRFVARGCLEGLLRELRRSYRLPSTDKFEYLAMRA